MADPQPPADTIETDRLARTIAAFVRAEFLAPVDVVGGFVDLLIEEATRDALADYLPDLDKIKAASTRLNGLVQGLLDLTDADLFMAGHEIEAITGKLRHDLRTPITAILGYGELLEEEAHDKGDKPLAGTLDSMLGASRALLVQIDAMVDVLRAQAGSATPGESLVEAPPHQPAVDAIRSVLFAEPEDQPRVTGRILVVDDSPANLDLLSRRLVRDGHSVETCPSGADALAALAREPFDLAMVDLIMPGMNGIELLRAMRAETATARVPVIMISAMDEVDGAVRCIEAGADDFLSKPLNPILLRARINAALERKLLRDRETEIADKLRIERERTEALLRSVLPSSVVDRLRAGETVIADDFEDVTILFCDLVGFTEMASRMRPDRMLDFLNGIFSDFDRLAAQNGLEKIKTIGDAYMVAGGLPKPLKDHARAVAGMAVKMPAIVATASRRIGEALDVRLGMHTGPVVAGIIGTHKFVYDVWGDTVNTASRMERYGVPGRIHITAATRRALGDRYAYDALPPMDIKGKGMMDTFLIR